MSVDLVFMRESIRDIRVTSFQSVDTYVSDLLKLQLHYSGMSACGEQRHNQIHDAGL
jgi:hypothetical protein